MSAHRGKFVAYYRVSTDRQGQSGLGLEAQRSAVLAYLNGGSWTMIAELTEVESGKHADRPQLAAALAACKKHKAKLVIAKLDRLSRNLAFIATLMDSGVEFVAVDNPHANKLTVHILAAVAQHEREMISQRTRDALQAAKARGKRLGNPNLASARQGALEANSAAADRFAANVRPIIEQIQKSGVSSLRGVARALTARGIKTARGGEWTARMVINVLERGALNRFCRLRLLRRRQWPHITPLPLKAQPRRWSGARLGFVARGETYPTPRCGAVAQCLGEVDANFLEKFGKDCF